MTAKLLVPYPTRADPEAFDACYRDHHLPLVRAVAGLRSVMRDAGPVGSPAGPSGYHQVSACTFASMADLLHGPGSEEGGAAAADPANFAPEGTPLLVYEKKEL